MKRSKVLLSIFSSALLVVPGLVGAQTNTLILKAPSSSQAAVEEATKFGRPSPTINIDQESVFRRVTGEPVAPSSLAAKSAASRPVPTGERGHRFARYKPVIAPAGRAAAGASPLTASSTVTPADEGTGSGDINEVEPNDNVAQNVDMPVNIFGAINPSGDIDSFAFPAFGGEQINVQAFASQIGSNLIADIGLFDAAGNLLDEQVGDGVNDPLIQFDVPSNGFYAVAITDADGFGGSHFFYVLNIEGGVDVQEQEPNDTTPNILPPLPATIFGNISSTTDRDFYSFQANAGQTLLVDVDAAVYGSNLISEVNLVDPSTGIQYFFNSHTDGDDPRFNIVLPFTGTYVLGIDAIGQATSGFYQMNVSILSGKDAPGISTVTTQGPKRIQVNGFGFAVGGTVNVNGTDVPSVRLDRHDVRGKVRWKSGDVVTISIAPGARRSNPLIIP
ncbi:MAG: hypothetical protein ACREDR_24720 [Blastocatellia bacterium]